MTDVTRILQSLNDGDPQATDDLIAAVYSELRRLAAHKLAHERADHTLQATALVHEAYLRLVGGDGDGWDNRAHFFAAGAEAMRRILVERARRRGRLKHGGGFQRQEMDEVDVVDPPDSVDLIALDEALDKLTAEDEKKAELVKLRYFAGLTIVDAAKLLGISRATADRYWSYARAFLFHEVGKD